MCLVHFVPCFMAPVDNDRQSSEKLCGALLEIGVQPPNEVSNVPVKLRVKPHVLWDLQHLSGDPIDIVLVQGFFIHFRHIGTLLGQPLESFLMTFLSRATSWTPGSWDFDSECSMRGAHQPIPVTGNP